MRALWWIPVVMGLGVLTVFLSERGTLDPASNLSLQVALPVERVLHDLGGDIDGFLGGLFDQGDLTRANQELREENERLKVKLAHLQDAEQRFEELSRLLEVKEGRPEDEFRVANVIAVDPSNLKENVAIDRGMEDGLHEGMVVLGAGGSLVGTVTKALRNFSWVTLVTSPSSVVNALVQGADVRGVVSGDLQEGLVLTTVSRVESIESDQLVITSGLGGNYPRSLLIGTVTSVDNRLQASSTEAFVEPATDLGRLETVLVMTNFTPARLAGP